MSKIILFTRPDGGVSVLHPTPETLSKFGTEDEAIAHVRSKSVPTDATEIKVIDESALPANRKFRDAWVSGDAEAAVDMAKARVIHMNRIREVRNDELKKEDINFQRALESEDASAKTSVANKKQALRDIPQTFDLSGASTSDELDALWPEDLDR